MKMNTIVKALMLIIKNQKDISDVLYLINTSKDIDKRIKEIQTTIDTIEYLVDEE